MSGVHRSELTSSDEITQKRKVSCPDCGFGPFTWSPWDELNRVTCPSCGNKNAQRTTSPEKARCEACGYGAPRSSKAELRLGPLVFFGIPGVVLLVVFGFFAAFRGIPPPSVTYQSAEPVQVRSIDCATASWSPRLGVSLGFCTGSWTTADGETRRGDIYGVEVKHDTADDPSVFEAREHNDVAYMEIGAADIALDVAFMLVPLVAGVGLILFAIAWSLRSFFSSSPRASPRAAARPPTTSSE